MTTKKELTSGEIGELLEAGENFTVNTSNERKKVLAGASFLSLRLITRKLDKGYSVEFLPNGK